MKRGFIEVAYRCRRSSVFGIAAVFLVFFNLGMRCLPQSAGLAAGWTIPQAFSEENANPEEGDTNPPGDVFHWVLAYWRTSQVECHFYLTHEGEPTHEEITAQCGEEALTAWKNTPACLSDDITQCTGLYISLIGMADPAEIPPSQASLDAGASTEVSNCPARETNDDPQGLALKDGNDCTPELEAKHNDLIEGDAFLYENLMSTEVKPFTSNEEEKTKYQPDQQKTEDFNENQYKFFLPPAQDGISAQPVQILKPHLEEDVDACAKIWDLYPDLQTEAAPWLARAEEPEFLATTVDYALLAGKLIWNGYVDASGCEGNGLLPNGAANACGQEQARELVVEWQNRLDATILNASEQAYIPPRLLKGLIAQETQFWPLWPEKNEFGYGMMTEKGIDMLLTWNWNYFSSLCKRYYTPDVCGNGYTNLTEAQRRFLQGVSLSVVGTDEEFVLLSNMLQATCGQTYQMIRNVTKKEPGKVFSYESLWRISLGVYHVGVGCMSEAMEYAWSDYGGKMTWDEFKRHLQPGCTGGRDYFDKVIYWGSSNYIN